MQKRDFPLYRTIAVESFKLISGMKLASWLVVLPTGTAGLAAGNGWLDPCYLDLA